MIYSREIQVWYNSSSPLRSGDAGCGTEEYGYGMRRDEA